MVQVRRWRTAWQLAELGILLTERDRDGGRAHADDGVEWSVDRDARRGPRHLELTCRRWDDDDGMMMG